MKNALSAILAVSTLATPVLAGEFLTEAEAHRQAVTILLGDPYGQTYTEVSQNIARAALVVAGETECNVVEQPVWIFSVVVPAKRYGEMPLEGFLELDATTGKMICSKLPYLQ